MTEHRRARGILTVVSFAAAAGVSVLLFEFPWSLVSFAVAAVLLRVVLRLGQD